MGPVSRVQVKEEANGSSCPQGQLGRKGENTMAEEGKSLELTDLGLDDF